MVVVVANFVIYHTTNLYADLLIINFTVILNTLVAGSNYMSDNEEEYDIAFMLYFVVLGMVTVTFYCMTAYLFLKKVYDVFVRSEMERIENDKLLELIGEGLLIVGQDHKQQILFKNQNFIDYLDI